MKRPLAGKRPFGPFVGDYSQGMARRDCEIRFTFISPEPDKRSIQKIIDEELIFASMDKGPAFPSDDPSNEYRDSVVVNTDETRLGMKTIEQVDNIYDPNSDEKIGIDARPTDDVELGTDLAQNKFVFTLYESMSLDEVKSKIVPKIGVTTISTFDEEFPKNLVGDQKFEISRPQTVSEAIEVYTVVRNELPLEKMFIQCISF